MALATRFRIAGIGYGVSAEGEALADRLARGFAEFAGDEAPADWHLHVRHAAPAALPPDHTVIWTGELPEGTPATIWRAGDALRGILVPGDLDARIDLGARQADIAVRDGCEVLLGGTAAIQIIDVGLTEARRELVHAACLALPESLGGPGAGCVLLFGDSGAGKSTTTLALARAGWPAGGDDGSVLMSREGRLVAYPYRRPFKVHRQTIALMPWLAETGAKPGDGEEEVGVGATRLTSLVSVLDPAREPLVVAGLVFLDPRNEAGHRFTHLAPTEAALRLYANNLHMPERRLDALGRGRIALFADLARQARFRLAVSAAPALETLPTALETAIAGAPDAERAMAPALTQSR